MAPPFRVLEGGKPPKPTHDEQSALATIAEARVNTLLASLVLRHGVDEAIAIAKRGIARLEKLAGR